MRVTASTYYKQYAKTVQNLHSELNKSMEQVSSGKKYSSGREDPLAYYGGMKIDSEYTDADTKKTVISDVNNRMYQQEAGARSVQTEMRSIQTDLLRLRNDSTSGSPATVDTLNQDMKQRLQTMTEDLNATYENFYVFGGNDMTTIPFSLDLQPDEQYPTSYTLNFDHHFPGESDTTTRMSITYSLAQQDGTDPVSGAAYKKGDLLVSFSGKRTDDTVPGDQGTELSSEDTLDYIRRAMEEEGRMSLGYGNLQNRETLPDTYTGGLNLLTGLTPAGLKALHGNNPTVTGTDGTTAGDTASDENAIYQTEYDTIQDRLTKSPIALTVKSVLSTSAYLKSDEASGTGSAETVEARNHMTSSIGSVIKDWDASEQRVASSYRELGIRQSVLKDTQTKLDTTMDTLQSNYDDKVGIDPYEAITKMYSQQYAYTAAMKVGSNIMQSSLFDYVK